MQDCWDTCIHVLLLTWLKAACRGTCRCLRVLLKVCGKVLVATFLFLMPRGFGREKLQLVCQFNSFSFTMEWAKFIRCCKQLVKQGQLKKLGMMRCSICKRGENPTPWNSCTRYPCAPRRYRDRWRPAMNSDNQMQLIFSGDWGELVCAWRWMYTLAQSLLGVTPDCLMQRIGEAASTWKSRPLMLEPEFEERYDVLAGRPLQRYLLPSCLLVVLWSRGDDEGMEEAVLGCLQPWLKSKCASLGQRILLFLRPWDDSIVNAMYRHAVFVRLANTIDTSASPVEFPAFEAWAQTLYRHWQAVCHPAKSFLHPQCVM